MQAQDELNDLGSSLTDTRFKELVVHIVALCHNPTIKDFLVQYYELDGTISSSQPTITDEAPQAAEEEDPEVYASIVQGLLGGNFSGYKSTLGLQFRRDRQALDQFLLDMGYGDRPSPGGREFMDMKYGDDAAQLIRCAAYPQECVAQSPLMNRLCLYNPVACTNDFISFLHLDMGTRRLIATFGAANFALSQAGYPALELDFP